MGDNFLIKRTIYISILDNDSAKIEHFHIWIRFLNEYSNVRTALTANIKLNVNLLRLIRYNSRTSNNGANLGFEFIVGNEVVRVSEDDLNEYLNLPKDNFVAPPSDAELLVFFQGINAALENGSVPRKFYKNALPKE